MWNNRQTNKRDWFNDVEQSITEFEDDLYSSDNLFEQVEKNKQRLLRKMSNYGTSDIEMMNIDDDTILSTNSTEITEDVPVVWENIVLNAITKQLKSEYRVNNGPRPVGVVGDYFWIPAAPELGLQQAVLVIDQLDVPKDLQKYSEPSYLFRNASNLFPPNSISAEEQMRLRSLVQQHRVDRDFGKFWKNVTSGKKMEPLNPKGALVYPYTPDRINNQTSDAQNIDETFLDTVRFIFEPLPLICQCGDKNHEHYVEHPFLKAIKQVSSKNKLPIAPLSILRRRMK